MPCAFYKGTEIDLKVKDFKREQVKEVNNAKDLD